MPAPPPDRPHRPASVWVLGFVSLLMDVSSEMIHSLLPLYLVGRLGVSVVVVGLIEGLAEATALMTKVFSGVLSDRLGRRKGLALAGYALGALTKPVFALSTGVGPIVAARFIDRVGKGIRGAPRDALVADLAPPAIRGAAFGLRQSLDTVGAFAGPLLATGLMLAWAQGWLLVGLGVVLWGIHMGLTQGLLAALVADAAPAGLLWQAFGSARTFQAGAVFAAVALLALRLPVRPRR